MNKIYLLALSLVLSACSYSTHYVVPEQGVFPPTDPKGVVITTQEEIHSTHKLIGPVSVIVWGNGESAREELQREAGRVGANAVIDLKLERGFFRTAASGLAVLLYRE